jgi:hypothetical protein
MSALGSACLIIYYAVQRQHLDPEIALRHGASFGLIQYEGTEWTAAWWKNAAHPRQAT